MAGLSFSHITKIALMHRCTGQNFGSWYSANAIPPFCSKHPIFYIDNSEPSYSNGKHWLLITVLSRDRTAEFFDPLRKDPGSYHSDIQTYLESKCRPHYIFNNIRYEPPDSKLCGLYCLVVADLRCRGKSIDEIMKWFDQNDLTKNDTVIDDYFIGHMYNGVLKRYL